MATLGPCDYRSTCEGATGVAHIEFGGVCDPLYTAETGHEHYGWWGTACRSCLAEIRAWVARDNGWLKEINQERRPT